MLPSMRTKNFAGVFKPRILKGGNYLGQSWLVLFAILYILIRRVQGEIREEEKAV